MTKDDYIQQHQAALYAVLTEFETREKPLGFEPPNETSEKIMEWMANNNLPPTLASVEMAVRKHVEAGYKLYLPADETNLRNIRWQYDANTLAIFDRWYGFQHIEKNPRTAAAILTECRGHQVDKSFLDLALGRAASKGMVTFSKAPGQETYIAGQYSGKDLRDTVKPEEMTDALGNRLHRTPRDVQGEAGKQFLASLERKEKEGRPSGHDENYWIERADKACGANLASTRGELVRMVITKKGTSTIDWEATAKAREAMQKDIGSR
jgi:hypothetical protein